MKTNNTLVLAYSGGLDTSFCIPYLKEKGFIIHAIFINTGASSKKDIKKLNKRAKTLGADYFESIDISHDFYQKCLKYLVYGNVLRGNSYPLSVSSERAFQALAILDYIHKTGAKYVAHGSTGAGNDQIRFDLIFRSLAPEIEIIAPIRQHQISREQEVEYLQSKGFNFMSKNKDYSINEGLWGISIGGKETLTSDLALPEIAYPEKRESISPTQISLSFLKGEVHALNGKKMSPIKLIRKLEKISKSYGIGRGIHIGDTIIGIKGRVGFQASSALIIIKAHEALEKHTLTKWQMHWKKQIGDWYGMHLHEGQYMDPTMRNLESFMESTQENVTGEINLTLYSRSFSIDGVQSANDLMNSAFGSYGENPKSWTGKDVIGFTKILANPHQIYYSVHKPKSI